MSMLSAQCDELRVLADELRQIKEHNTDWLHMEAVTLSSSVDAMYDAADTIESLRDRLQDAALSLECELVETESYSNAHEVIHVLECSACGRTCEHVNGAYPRCPHCGAHVKRKEDVG